MTIQDVFVIGRHGVVATGRVEDGPLRVGDEVQIKGALTARVDGIQAFRKRLHEATAGDNIGVLFFRLDKGSPARGDVMTSSGSPTVW
jgi:translation elongation factor EF-Tu-like GTPase